MNPDEAEALPAIKLLRAALDIPATEDVLQTLVGQRLISNQNALKEIAA